MSSTNFRTLTGKQVAWTHDVNCGDNGNWKCGGCGDTGYGKRGEANTHASQCRGE